MNLIVPKQYFDLNFCSFEQKTTEINYHNHLNHIYRLIHTPMLFCEYFQNKYANYILEKHNKQIDISSLSNYIC